MKGIEWFVCDGKFDAWYVYFTHLSEQALAMRVHQVSDEIEKLLGEVEDDEGVIDTLSNDLVSEVVASSEFTYDEELGRLVVWDPDAQAYAPDPSDLTGIVHGIDDLSVLTRFSSALDISLFNEDYEKNTLQVLIFRKLFAIDPEGLFHDGERLIPVRDLMKKLEKFRAYGDPEPGDVYLPPTSGKLTLADVLLSAWTRLQSSPAALNLFRQKILAANEDVRELFQAALRDRNSTDEELQDSVDLGDGSFAEARAAILAIVESVEENGKS